MRMLGGILLAIEIVFFGYMFFSLGIQLWFVSIASLLFLGGILTLSDYLYLRSQKDVTYFIPTFCLIAIAGILLVILSLGNYGLGGLLLLLPAVYLIMVAVITSTVFLLKID